MKKQFPSSRRFIPVFLFVFICVMPMKSLHAQDYVTGAFEGVVKNSATGEAVPGATVQIINNDTGVPIARQTDSQGRFRQSLLPPGDYTVRVSKQGFLSYESQQSLPPMKATTVIPLPVNLKPEAPTPIATATPSEVEPTVKDASKPVAVPSPTQKPQKSSAGASILAEINTTDAQRGGTYNEKEISTLPLGGGSLTRTFDELGLLIPGVALPPQTQGSVAGPGVGAGVGSSGQFAVNGLRSRANNFTVDGSDNNDEDIGVRRQGFLALVPQPIESIQGYQIVTLLAPAQYGRNFGAQVNAVSKSGGNDYHGAFFGFFNSSQLNAANPFDSTSGNTNLPLQGRTPGGQFRDVFIDNRRAFVSNNAGKKDSFTLGQGGLVFGGPLVPSEPARPDHSLFFFISAEGHLLHATKEESFAVPTVGQRGLLGAGATGLTTTGGDPVFPTRVMGDAIFSLFPFPNNPRGIYGENTLTQVLPYSGRGKIVSGKVNGNFRAFGKSQEFVARYNFTNDWRDIPVTGGAIFSALRPRVGTQNFSTYLNTPQLTDSASNQLRLSYGRTRLNFEELRDPSLIASQQSPNTPFLLNRPRLLNDTLPAIFGNPFCPTVNSICYETSSTTEQGDTVLGRGTGPLGQVIISGYSPVGVDVFNFPQRRVNNTYQLADTISLRRGRSNFAFGVDTRRTELSSDLPRNARPLAIFGGTLPIPGALALSPTDLAAAGAPSGFFQTLARGDSAIHLRYYQLNFFGQDELRIRPNLSLSFGVRYEFNTVPHETNNRIESTFKSSDLALVPDLQTFISGRSQIYDPDRNNIAPRIGVAYSPSLFDGKQTVIRFGYGLYYDQMLGAVISQSRNVYPTFLTINSAGGVINSAGIRDFNLFNLTFSINNNRCAGLVINNVSNCYVVPGTLNRLNAPFVDVVTFNRDNRVGGFGFTLPQRDLQTPIAHQYGATVEQQLSNNLVLSAAYVGTLGRDLLRLTTPNLGPNVVIKINNIVAGGASGAEPVVLGTVLAPGNQPRRPLPTAGSVNIFRSNARSRYDALQVQLRGRYSLLGATQFQVNYTYGKVTDDVSDVFDLAGAPSLPQNSVTFAGENGPANFDVRHRVTSNYISDFSSWGKNNSFLHAIFNGLEIAGTGTFQTGQPFTVNSVYDVNLDGNLTDRLDSTNGIVLTGVRNQPLRLTANPATLLAPVGQDGKVPRNSFRATNLWLTNAAVIKTVGFSESTKLIFRTEFFNIFNRANFGIPVRLLEAPGGAFGRSTDTLTPARRIQFGLKVIF